MTEIIVRSEEPVTLLGSGALGERDLADALSLAPRLVAADGGAAAALAAGHAPEAVIGDFDSLTPDLAARLPADRLHRIDEQETTDFDKALRAIAAPLVLGIGLTGARFDHHLAACHVLLRHPDRRCVLVGEDDLVFLCPPDLELGLAPGSRLSLFPMAPVSGRSVGLRWPIDGIAFDPASRIGTSNAVTGPVRLTLDAPRMLAITPRGALAAVSAALAAAPARWPAPAR